MINPTPAAREKLQQIAAAIVAAVRANVKIPLPGLEAIAIQSKGLFFDAVEVEAFVVKLAQEITILIEERTMKEPPPC